MLYLDNTTDLQTIAIPRNGFGGRFVAMTLSMWSTVNLKTYARLVVPDSVDGDYVRVRITLNGSMPDGEYKYTLTNRDGFIKDTISTGLLIIGELQKPDEYNNITSYEQYEEE